MVYVVYDADLHFLVGVYKTLIEVMRKAMETIIDIDEYDSYTFTVDKDDSKMFYITFPHTDSKCVGHWNIIMSKIEG